MELAPYPFTLSIDQAKGVTAKPVHVSIGFGRAAIAK